VAAHAHRRLDERLTEPLAPVPHARAKRLVVRWPLPFVSQAYAVCFAEQERDRASAAVTPARNDPQASNRADLAPPFRAKVA
jgi:hypothetical protein